MKIYKLDIIVKKFDLLWLFLYVLFCNIAHFNWYFHQASFSLAMLQSFRAIAFIGKQTWKQQAKLF